MCAPRTKRHRVLRSARSTRHETLPERTQRYMRQGYHASRPSRLRTHRPSAELTSPSLHSIAATALLLACSLSSSSSTALSEPRAVCPSPRASTATHLGRVEDLTYVEAQRPTRRLAEAVRCFGGRISIWCDRGEWCVCVAAPGGTGHGPEQRARLGLAARSCSAHRAANLRRALPTPWWLQRTWRSKAQFLSS